MKWFATQTYSMSAYTPGSEMPLRSESLLDAYRLENYAQLDLVYYC
jgi:hypothetical protein